MEFAQAGQCRRLIVALAVFVLSSSAHGQGQTPVQPAAQPSGSGALLLDQAIRLALNQASQFQQSRIAELIAREDVRQAKIAFLPKFEATLAETYNSPEGGTLPPGAPREMSFINANAITEHLAAGGIAGDLDVSGKLRATLRRNVALLEAARAGTEIARRALIQAVTESYYGLSLAVAKRKSAETALGAAQEFESITRGLFTAGEVAEVDVTRARLQTATRTDELQQSQAAEFGAQDLLRVLVGYEFSAPIATTDLDVAPPELSELDRYNMATITGRPEIAQFSAELRAAEQERIAARADRLPKVSYFVQGGFDSDSLGSTALEHHTGVLAGVTITVPVFDWGAAKSREKQAQLRAKTVENEKALALRTFGQQFNTALAQARVAAARFRLLQASVADADRNVQTSVARYRAGEAQIVEVTDAQTTLATQRAAMVQAIYDYQIARSRLAQAAGQ